MKRAVTISVNGVSPATGVEPRTLLAVQAVGSEVTTIDGVSENGELLQTSLSPDEILTEVRVPKAANSASVKFNQRAQDWAIVGAAAVVRGSSARDALTGVGSLDAPSDTAASGEYRAHLARVLVRRALEAAMAR